MANELGVESKGKGRAAGVFGGAVASVCCIGPAAAIAAGAGTGSIFIVLGNYRPLFLVVGALVGLVLAFALTRRAGQSCPVDQRRNWYSNVLTTTVAAFLVTALLGRVIIPRIIESF